MANLKSLTLIDAVLPNIEDKVFAILRDIALILTFAILTGISARLKIEIGPVPITMQTFMVLFSGILLGSKKGALSQLTYIAGGLAGLPWFSRGGGIQYILSPTFGYIIGFVLSAYFVGYLAERGLDRNMRTAVLAMFAGNIILYIPGLFWLSRFVGFNRALTIGLYPFLAGDLTKIIVAGITLPKIWQMLKGRDLK